MGRGHEDWDSRKWALETWDEERGTRRLGDVGLGDVGLRDVGRGDSGTRGLGDAWRLGNVMNKPYFWAEFVKYDYKDREENTVTYQESPP